MIFVASDSPPNLPIRRNTVILSATMAVNSAVLQLTAFLAVLWALAMIALLPP